METHALFDGEYTITDDGRLYSNRSGKWLKPNTDKYGYLYYITSINGRRKTVKSHRAVAECFIDNPENKPTVDHINGNRKDNRVCNLRWATWKEQQLNDVTRIRAMEVHKRTDYKTMGAMRNFGRKRVAVTDMHGNKMEFKTLKLAATACNVNMGHASECANGKRRHAGGYEFCYV